MVSCKIITRCIRIPLVVTYLTPLTLNHLPDLEEELQRFKGLGSIIIGDFNVDLDAVQSSRSELLADLLMEFGLIDLIWHFRQCLRFLYLKTWAQFRQGTVIRLQCNYTLGTYQHRFEFVGILDIRNYVYDHFTLWAQILQRPTRCHDQYLRGHW